MREAGCGRQDEGGRTREVLSDAVFTRVSVWLSNTAPVDPLP